MFGFLKIAACAQSPETNCASRSDENDVEIQLSTKTNYLWLASVFCSTPSPKKRLV